MAAELELHPAVARGRLLPHALAHGHGAGERDRADALVAHELGARRRPRAGEDVQHPRREPGLGESLGDVEPRSRRLVAELEHDGVPVDEGRRELPDRDRDREVPGRDEADDADRPPQRVQPLVRHGGLEHLADRAPGLARRVAEDRRGPQRLEARLAQRLPHLRGHVVRDLLRAGLEHVRRLRQERRPLGRGQGRPGGERLAGRLDRRARVVRVGGRIDTDDLVRPPGASLLVRRAARRRVPAAADVVAGGCSGQGLRHGLGSFRSAPRRGRPG